MMIVLIAQDTGLADVAALAAIFAVNAAMIFFGWLQEVYEQPGGGFLPFIFGSMIGIVPWLIVAFFVIAAGVRVRDHRVAVPVLQRVRPQPVPAVQAGRALGGLPGRGTRLHSPEPLVAKSLLA